MVEPSRDELLAQIAELQRQLQRQGARSVTVGGNVRESVVITGDHASYYGSVETLNIASAVFEAPAPPGQVASKELLWTYLNQVVADNATLNLSGVDHRVLSEQDEARLELAAVYTALNTMRSVGEEAKRGGRKRPAALPESGGKERHSAVTFVNQTPYTALLGDPGSGKTTFVNFLALCLAGEMLGLTEVNLARLGKEWTAGALLPVQVVLRQFAAQTASTSVTGTESLLWTYVVKRLGNGLPDFAPLLRRHLLEQGGLLILDGLDEVPEVQRQRERVKQAVLGFRRQFPRMRILLTSRTYAYQRQHWELPDFKEAVLAPFDQKQTDAFVDRWYDHMAAVRSGLTMAEARGRAVLLKQAVRQNPFLRDLAPRPLLLTLMASLHAWRGGSLPEGREQLYDESVELLLDIWERPKSVLDESGTPVVQSESMGEWLRCPQTKVRAALEKLAYEVHAGQAEMTGTADIDEGKLVVALMRAADDPELKQERVVEYIRDRAGLLVARGEGVYVFPHRTFQEYLAARHLSESGFPNLLVKMALGEPERWREVTLLAGAKVARGSPFAAWVLVDRLCARPYDAASVAAATEREWWGALLAGQLLVETGIHSKLDPVDDATDLDTLGRVRHWLMALVGGGHLSRVDRAAAGQALGWLGDERLGVGMKDGLPDIAWAEVEAGPFVMGSDKQEASRDRGNHIGGRPGSRDGARLR
jgi:hypothetical protein